MQRLQRLSTSKKVSDVGDGRIIIFFGMNKEQTERVLCTML